MGSLFVHIQAKNAVPCAIQSVFGADTQTITLPNDWVRVSIPTSQLEELPVLARSLSLAVPGPVITTIYYHDIFAEFGLYLHGNKADQFLPAPCQGTVRKRGNTSAWTRTFGFSEAEARLARAVFLLEKCKPALEGLEKLLQTQFWDERQSTPEDVDILEAYLVELAKRKRVHNHTRLQARDEFGSDKFSIAGRLLISHIRRQQVFYRVEDNAAVTRLFQVMSLGAFVPRYGQALGEGVASASFLARNSETRIPRLYFFRTNGKEIDNARYIDVFGRARVTPIFLDDQRIFGGGVCYNFANHRVEWNLRLPAYRGGHHEPVRLQNGNIAFCFDQTENVPQPRTVLCVITPTGQVVKSQRFPYAPHWQTPHYHKGRLYFQIMEPKGATLLCYDDALQETHRVTLNSSIVPPVPCLDAVNGRLLFQTNENLYAIYDVRSKQLLPVQPLRVREAVPMRYWPGLGPMLQTDEMTFEIWDETLQTISRHSLKGKLAGWFPAKNSECVLLSLTAGQPETPELLRTYTLSLL